MVNWSLFYNKIYWFSFENVLESFFSRGLFFDCELGNLLKVCDSGVLTFHKKNVQ